ncbi:amino acid adenylation domain-containing protein [Streptomyces platensis]|uniref:amino acid adenylation domain-containing protein n=1 Tax=Streptomyces platensis TaxID=58346 RepID=UPI002E266559|nr:amino acid adenylation domain-containing protein [Streptomyces platensis]WUB84567.1 amino acid adenylation domain-containing protein [Streptomyces platensis]
MRDRVLAAESLIDLFRMTVRDHPQSVAVSSGHERLTYAQLDEKSDAVCQRILDSQSGQADLVGVFVGRDIESIVSILGVMKTGAAYVPLDPTYPARRLSHLIGDSKIDTIVGSLEVRPEIDVHGLEIIDPREARPRRKNSRLAAPRCILAAGDPAYVIYTSGSTGQPKGCVVTHANVLALLGGALPLFDFTPGDRWALFHSLSFDFSVWELWGAFATGATVVCVPVGAAQSAEGFIDFLVSEEVSVLNQVPSIFRYTLSVYREVAVPLPVRHLIFGGESVDLKDVAEFLALTPDVPPAVTNMYGITETTVHATFKRITEQDLTGTVRSPIGRPLPHLGVEIRGECNEAVPDGQVGEMWLYGAGVADGYLNRAQLTAERFVEGPTESDVRRYYRSGDLARRLPGGELEYLGRADHQVKLMGFRIELGEVEATLERHPNVRGAVALVTTSRTGAPVLSACVIPTQARPGDLARELRTWATGRVPRHMVPHLFHTVDSFPLTASGKTDRAAIAEAIGGTNTPC